jgi:DNA-binding transcriptional ArsR family regulator
MAHEHVVELGKLLGDATRIAVLDALFDGRAYTVTELARHVGVATSTCSEHLGRLLDGGLVSIEPQGRHRYYRLSGAETAALLETMFEFGHGEQVRRSSSVPAGMAYARSCYDHLAGTLAVGLTDALEDRGFVDLADGQAHLTATGTEHFRDLGITGEPRSRNRPVVRRCLDWSERRPHLAGALPAAFLDHMLEHAWLTRPGGRALWLTNKGRSELRINFGYEAP